MKFILDSQREDLKVVQISMQHTEMPSIWDIASITFARQFFALEIQRSNGHVNQATAELIGK